jgi:predicted esterase
LRSYPAIVALHAGGGPASAVSWWAEEAARQGVIVIAPEYRLRGQPSDYRYTAAEHAAVELALRDARRRFAIDADRVFLGGQLLGAFMAWDFALAHPDLFAGAVVVSGIPAKYTWAYKDNAKRLPMYIAMGQLAPTESSHIFELGKTLIGRNYDVTYVEHYQRGLEDFPEVRPDVFEWMSHRRRDPLPKDEVSCVTARTCDDRFYGVLVRDFAPGRSITPALADPLGKNIKPASVSVQAKGFGSLLVVKTTGLRKIDVWVSPEQIDLTKRFEVRVNRTTVFKGMADLDFEPFLEDLRLRGDRQQVYALKIPVSLGGR